MATKNPRVVGYVNPENHAQLKEFIEQHSLTESKAIDNILSQFFSTASEPESSNQSSTLKEVLNRVTVLEQQMAEVMGESLTWETKTLPSGNSTIVAYLKRQRLHSFYQGIRDRYLSQLKLGKQAPSYKAAAKAFDYLISQLKSDANTSD